jgi:hypothetical protein
MAVHQVCAAVGQKRPSALQKRSSEVAPQGDATRSHATSVVAAWPVVARAQQGDGVRQIGVLM